MDAGQETEFLDGDFVGFDAEFLVELADRGALGTLDGGVEVVAGFGGHAEWVRAAGVGPHVREGDFLRGALLEEEAVLGVEEEGGEGAVEEAAVNVFH